MSRKIAETDELRYLEVRPPITRRLVTLRPEVLCSSALGNYFDVTHGSADNSVEDGFVTEDNTASKGR